MQPAKASVVETITGLGTPLPLKLSQIRPFADQPRKYFDPEKLEVLADSIQADGQATPVAVRTLPGEKGIFELIDGQRRFHAFEIIRQRTGKEPIVLAFVRVIHDSKDQYKKSFVANLQNEDFTSLEKAAGLHRLHVEDGETLAALKVMTGYSISYIENYIKVHGLPDGVKRLMDPRRDKEEQLSITTAIDIARGIPVSDVQLRTRVATEILERKLGVLQARALVKEHASGGGHTLGGRERKPSDDYAIFVGVLTRTRNAAEPLLDLDMDDLYLYRADEVFDRREDGKALDGIIRTLTELRERVAEKKKQK